MVVHAEIGVERSDAPCSGGVYEDSGYNFYRYSIGESDPSTHIVINEIEQNPYGIDEGYEWVELYNPTISDVNLDGWRLSTTHGKTVTVTLRGTIPANGYFVYMHTEQWLDNVGESVTLRDLSLNEVDRTPYVPDTNGTRYSWQRYPNGKDTDSDSDWEFRASTEGRSNGEPPPAKTIYVDDDFVDDPPNHKWDTIQEGINDANSGDTIIVSDGTYNENVDVDKRLTIRSENGADVTLVRSASSSDHVFEVTANWVNITGFTVTGATYPGASPGLGISGIRLSYACYCNISNNNASNNDCGIYLYYSSSNTLTNNNANSNNWLGICLSFSSNNTLRSNTASNNDIIHIETAVVGNNYNSGICLYFSSNNTLTNNNANSNNYNSGIYLRFSSDNTLRSNTASNNNYGIYMLYSSNNTLTNNTANSNTCDGIVLDSSSSNTLKNNNVSDNSRIGIGMWDSNNNILQNSAANSNNLYGGIYLSSSSGNTLINNTASNNFFCGIFLDSSSNNTLKDNTANSNNGSGIYLLYSSRNNTLQKNTALNNHNGIHLWNSSNNNIVCNWVQNNTQNGFRLYDGSTGNNISYNNIIENGNYNATSGGWEWQFYNDQSIPVEAKHNYWGAGMNNSTIDASIYDNECEGKVEFYPFETDPIQCPLTTEPHVFTPADAVIALEIAVGSREYDPFWDINHDGRVTSLDALMILQTVAGRIGID